MPVGIEKDTRSIGCYDLVEKIAEGGMGTVYKACHKQTGQIVAIKVLSAHLAKNLVLLQRFDKEYKAARALNHPNIVQAIESGRDGESPYLVMEYVGGESLGQRLEREKRLEPAEALRIIGHVAQGLHRAHKLGMIHRDVKPDNILLTADGQVKLADLGLVKVELEDHSLTRTGRGLGTPHFMAPEQFRNAKNAGIRCDIYSLAATLYMMVTGELPFDANGPVEVLMKKVNNELVPPRELVPGLSERVDWAIRRSMSPEPEKRPKTCREFVEDLTGHGTRKLTPVAGETQTDVWFAAYTDGEGVRHTVRGSVEGIRRSLKEGPLRDASQVRVSKQKSGPFEPLREYPEFRDLVVEPGVADAPSTPSTSSASSTPSTSSTPLPPPTSRLPCLAPTAPTPDSVARSVTDPAPQPAVAKSAVRPRPKPAPHIDMGADASEHDWMKWAGLILIAAVSGVAGYLLMR
jgi:serine/threonine protein kinase